MLMLKSTKLQILFTKLFLLYSKSPFPLHSLPSKENVILLSSSVSDVTRAYNLVLFSFFNSGESEIMTSSTSWEVVHEAEVDEAELFSFEAWDFHWNQTP